MIVFKPGRLEVRASADGDATDRFRWSVAIPRRWVIERSVDVFPTEREAVQAGLAVLKDRSLPADVGDRRSAAARTLEPFVTAVRMLRLLVGRMARTTCIWPQRHRRFHMAGDALPKRVAQG